MKQAHPSSKHLKIGLALGSGSARGWAHIGVIRELESMGIVIDAVAGCSIGALVGGVFAQGKLDILETWALKLTKRQVAGFMDPSFGYGGIIKGTRIIERLRYIGLDGDISEFPIPFAAVATEITQGEEIWLEKGPFLDAVRASGSIPGLVCPHFHQNKWLIDGGVVNPVPVALTRKLGCDKVIAVNLNQDLSCSKEPDRSVSLLSWMQEASKRLPSFLSHSLEEVFLSAENPETPQSPGYRQVVWSMMSIMQDRLTKYRMHIEPADVELNPKLSKIGIMDFHTAETSIEEGRRIVRENADLILKLIQAPVSFHHDEVELKN